MPASIADHVVSTSDLCGGRPRIAGTGVRVQDIVSDYELHGMSPEEIARGYAGMSLAQVHAALSYYYGHRDEIQGHIRGDREFVKQLQADQRTQSAVGTDASPISP
jgi:uncharacterized protein (DUF433 family)